MLLGLSSLAAHPLVRSSPLGSDLISNKFAANPLSLPDCLAPPPSLPTGRSRPEAQYVPYYVSQCASGRWGKRATATALIPLDPDSPRRSLPPLTVTLTLDCKQPRASCGNGLLESACSFLTHPPTRSRLALSAQANRSDSSGEASVE